MPKSKYYFSVQYSAIQKTILRHDRLWSIAGVSAILSWLNEIEMPRIAKDLDGEVLLAGGGKFTASFEGRQPAVDAREQILKAVATTLPMLEYQASIIIEALSLKEAKEKGLLRELREKKNAFRGYGVTFNPHLQRCKECKEYPAVVAAQSLCAICAKAYAKARSYNQNMHRGIQTITLDRIYDQYLEQIETPGDNAKLKIPLDFENLFTCNQPKQGNGSADTSEINRMAVWFSDLNNMKDKVILWGNQKDELIRDTFNDVKSLNVQIITQALQKTFPKICGTFIPFRLIVAGGDDLCLVMDAKKILSFAVNISKALNEAIGQLDAAHPLLRQNLRKTMVQFITDNPEYKGRLDVEAPFCFGASFIIASVHTPFSKIHAAGEHLMGLAKRKSRLANSVYWGVMPELTQTLKQELQLERELFDKPLFIDELPGNWQDNGTSSLTLNDYLFLLQKSGNISGAHRYQIVQKLAQLSLSYPGNPDIQSEELEHWIKVAVATGLQKDFEFLLTEERFYEDSEGNRRLDSKRIATLLELMSLTYE